MTDAGVLDPRRGKRSWRAWARAQRDRIDVAAWSAAACTTLRAWSAFASARCIGAYRAFGQHEANLDAVLRETSRVVYPRTVGEPGAWSTRWAWPDADGDAWEDGFERHPLGMLQPGDDAPAVDVSDVDVVIVPGVAFDRWGTRLGRGQGQYDRLLAGRRPGTLLVGVTHPLLLADDPLVREPHDVPMTHLLVLDRIVKVDRREGVSVG